MKPKEKNRIIAEFMAIEVYDYDDDGNVQYINPKDSARIITAKYSSSWDWLMPVLDKIYSSNEYYKYKNETSSQFHDGSITINTKFIETTCNEVVEYIQWFKKLKK